MCKDFFDLSVFNELYGLSCVENLLLFILKSYQYSYNYLFYNSLFKAAGHTGNLGLKWFWSIASYKFKPMLFGVPF